MTDLIYSGAMAPRCGGRQALAGFFYFCTATGRGGKPFNPDVIRTTAPLIPSGLGTGHGSLEGEPGFYGALGDCCALSGVGAAGALSCGEVDHERRQEQNS
ncbi:hypothetical protein SAMN05216233_11998 [Desulfoluna spongiiphila]|uniref:Uncharacterized protein n=1 Tax=Desulfoluna spongiiphila TaxID=419481 RepID=A0A1G5IGL5_9BACT|nr:hypothetical protein SAMN05216233_11998 [Desulfoluna spongiiphila]VVS95449.1 hypothetical protein DBB_50260 [Desulfoluna spongiiphila]